MLLHVEHGDEAILMVSCWGAGEVRRARCLHSRPGRRRGVNLAGVVLLARWGVPYQVHILAGSLTPTQQLIHQSVAGVPGLLTHVLDHLVVHEFRRAPFGTGRMFKECKEKDLST